MSLSDKIRAELQPYFKKQSGAEYRYTCPWRTGADGETLAVNYDKGTFIDHKGVALGEPDSQGRFKTLAKNLSIPVDEDGRGGAVDTLRSYKDLAEYAATQGAPIEAFENAKVKQGHHMKRPALMFPMKSPSGTVQAQYRFLDGKKPKWIGQKGFKRCWYGLNAVTKINVYFDGTPLIICNGATSVIVAQHYGLPAVAIPGGENANIPEELMAQLDEWRGDDPRPEIIVAMDCDQVGRRIGASMADNLRKAGYNARAVDLGLGDKGDLANFCKFHTDDSLTELRKLPPLRANDDDIMLPVQGIPQDKIIAQGKTWLVMHARERDCIPTVEWVVPGEIPKRALTAIFGPSGVGKSFFIIDRALKVAQDAPVIYAALEGETGVPSRIDAWCKHHQKTEGNLYLSLGEVNFFDETEVRLFADGVKSIEPVMIIIDTLARAMGDGDENSTRDMNKLMKLCKRVQMQLDCAVVLVHHTNKDGDNYRGSSSLKGAADSMIALVDDDDYIQVECFKTKDAKPFQTYFMTLIPVDVGVVDASGESLATPVIVAAERNLSDELTELTIRQRKVLEVLGQSVFEYGATPGQVAQVVNGVPERSVYRVMSRLKSSGFISQAGARKPYCLTNKGREVMGLQLLDTATHDTNATADTLPDDDSTANAISEHAGRYGISGSNGSNGNLPLLSDRDLAQAVDPANYGYGS